MQRSQHCDVSNHPCYQLLPHRSRTLQTLLPPARRRDRGGGFRGAPFLGRSLPLEALRRGVSGGLRVLQAGKGAEDLGGGLPEDDGREWGFRGRVSSIPEEDFNESGFGRRDLPAQSNHFPAAESLHERGAFGGGSGDVRGVGRAFRENGR